MPDNMENLILVVEDEKSISDILKINLQKNGFRVITAFDGEDAVKKAFELEPDLILLDVMLPKLDGFSVCKQVRESLSVPIIMLTAREEEVDKVLGLELGADDYITKPFSLRELMARVKANLRRSGLSSWTSEHTGILEFGNLQIDTEKYEVTKCGKHVDLTSREFDLLKFLATSGGKVFTREILLNKVWDYEYYGDVRTVDVTIRRLREKIEDNPSEPKFIMTKRGVGYYFGA